jgi:limonene-1,2-epoxide hydrolase
MSDIIAQNIVITQKWFEAFNEHHLENLLMLYHENAQHYSPKLKVHQPKTLGLIKGKKQLRAWWQDAFIRLPQLKYHVLNIVANEQFVFMEYIRNTPTEPDLQVGEVLEIHNGLIISSRVYHS